MAMLLLHRVAAAGTRQQGQRGHQHDIYSPIGRCKDPKFRRSAIRLTKTSKYRTGTSTGGRYSLCVDAEPQHATAG